MITSTDLIHLPYTPDLSEAGIIYACRSLASATGAGGPVAERLRRSSGAAAVELAFRRYLSEQAVPFDTLDSTPFTQPGHYDIALGRHRCKLTSSLVTRSSASATLQRNPGSLLRAPALVPVEHFASEDCRPDDLYLFAYLAGETAAAQADIKKAISAGKPVYLVHALPAAWARPSGWAPLENLALKSECDSPLTIEIGGQDAERNFITARLELPPRQRVAVGQPFHSLAFVHADRLPEARLEVHSPLLGEAYLIAPYAWGNIWIEAQEALLAGWLTHEDYRRKAKVLLAGTQPFPYERTAVKNLFVPMSELKPLGILLKKVRAWAAENKQPRVSS